MPTYEYVCDAGHETEHRHSINDPALEVCPTEGCEARAERKISLGAGVITGSKGSDASTGDACGPNCCSTSGSSGFT
jgi:putative FmdB family regulatory protein